MSHSVTNFVGGISIKRLMLAEDVIAEESNIPYLDDSVNNKEMKMLDEDLMNSSFVPMNLESSINSNFVFEDSFLGVPESNSKIVKFSDKINTIKKLQVLSERYRLHIKYVKQI